MKKLFTIILVLCFAGLVRGQWVQLSTQDAINAALKNNTVWIGKTAVYGKVPVYQFGLNTSVAATNEDISVLADSVKYINAGQSLSIYSTNANDKSNGSGARTVTIYGLGSSWAYQSETVTLAGKDTVNTSSKFIRVWDAVVATAGSGGVNDGAIKIEDYAADTVMAYIDSTSGFNRCLMATLTVPANKTLYLTNITAETHTNKSTVISLYTRKSGGVFYLRDMFEIQTGGPVVKTYQVPLAISDSTDVVLRANAGGGGGHVTGSFTGWWE
jgi:hypothetical protein